MHDKVFSNYLPSSKPKNSKGLIGSLKRLAKIVQPPVGLSSSACLVLCKSMKSKHHFINVTLSEIDLPDLLFGLS